MPDKIVTRVAQIEGDDKLLLSEPQLHKLRAGDLLADGMVTAGDTGWVWNRVRVVAVDRAAKVLVLRWPDGNWDAIGFDEAESMYARWDRVCDRTPLIETDEGVWAA